MSEIVLEDISKQLEDILLRLSYIEGKLGDKKAAGRPSKKALVEKYQEKHPLETKASCAKATGISRKTVRKYWK